MHNNDSVKLYMYNVFNGCKYLTNDNLSLSTIDFADKYRFTFVNYSLHSLTIA